MSAAENTAPIGQACRLRPRCAHCGGRDGHRNDPHLVTCDHCGAICMRVAKPAKAPTPRRDDRVLAVFDRYAPSGERGELRIILRLSALNPFVDVRLWFQEKSRWLPVGEGNAIKAREFRELGHAFLSAADELAATGTGGGR